MIERYLRLLDSFKEYQISALLLTIREKILSTIQSEHISSRANDYFDKVETCRFFLMAEPFDVNDLPNDTNAAYIVTPDNKFYYFNRKEPQPLVAIDIVKNCPLYLMAPPLAIENFPEDINTALVVTFDKKLHYFNRNNKNSDASFLCPIADDPEEVNHLLEELNLVDVELDETETIKLLLENLYPDELAIINERVGAGKLKQFFQLLADTEKPRRHTSDNFTGNSLLLMKPPLSIEDIPLDVKSAYILTPYHKLYYFSQDTQVLLHIDINEEHAIEWQKQLQLDEISLSEEEAFKCLIPDLSAKEINSIATLTDHIHFKSPLQKCRQEELALPPRQDSQLVIDSLSREQKDIITNMFGHVHIEIEPFADFAAQPKQIVQLKEIINALYHAQLAFADLESVDLRSGKSRREDLSRLYHNTILHSYKASYLLTHLDFDLTQAFSQEITTILSIFSAIQDYADNNATLKKHKDEAVEKAKHLQASSIDKYAHKAGFISGICLDQLQPNTGQIDYNFLAHFGAILPGYIQQLTAYIKKYSTEITELESTLDKKKIAALQDDAILLLHAIENIQDSSAILSLKVIHYIRIIRHIITLSSSTLEQMGHMTETSQDVIRNNIAKIKYELLTELFALVDKIEDETLMAPGTLSKPLMTVVVPFYNELIRFAKKPVDFSVKGEELLTIEDSRFIDIRLEATQNRINKAKQNLFKAEYVQVAIKKFFYILEKPKNKDKRIIDLAKPTKLALARYYRYLQPYFEKLDVDLNNEIILNFEKFSGKWDKTRDGFYKIIGSSSIDSIANIIAYKKQLVELVASELATQEFHIALNNDIIDGVYQRANLTLRPLNPSLCDLTFNEGRVLALDNLEQDPLAVRLLDGNLFVTNPIALSSEQALNLFEYYEKICSKYLRAKQAFKEFLALLEVNHPTPLPQLDNFTKEKLRNLYIIFQPYFVGYYSDDAGMTLLDKSTIANLKADQTNSKPAITGGHFLRLQEKFDKFLNFSIQSSDARKKLYEELAHEKLQEEMQTRALIPNYSYGNRAHYIIKHTHYSKAIHEFRESLFQLTGFLNQSFRNKLMPAESGLPFPELKDSKQLLSQCKQVVSIKRIFNSLYHLEQICIHLEQLNDKSSQSVYVSYLVKAYSHINDLRTLTTACYEDPYLALMAKDLLSKAETIQQIFLQQTEPYTKDASNVAAVKGNIKNNAIWYSLQTLMLVPEHIHALYKKSPLTEKELAVIQANTKRLIVNIEGIIASSNSYFKLLLKTPVMLRLFLELKQKLALFTNTSHEAALSNLKELHTELFTRILLETDLWEDQLGLQPGQLSGHMKSILDEFYKGLLEPLNLISPKHIDCVTNTVTFDKRIVANDIKIANAKDQQAVVLEERNIFITLIDAINSYKNFNGGYGPRADDYFIEHSKEALLLAYQKAYPLLIKIYPHLGRPSSDVKNNEQIDAFINDTLEEDSIKFNNIPALAETACYYYQGVISSYQLEQDTAHEKNYYLHKLRDKQQQDNEKFITEYATEMFEKRVNTILNSQKSLLFVHMEYNKKLQENLMTFQQEVITKILPSEENRAKIKQSLGALTAAIPEDDVLMQEKANELSELLSVSMPTDDIVTKADKLIGLLEQKHALLSIELKIKEITAASSHENSQVADILRALTTLRDMISADYPEAARRISDFMSHYNPIPPEAELKKYVRRLLKELSNTMSSELKCQEINRLLDNLSLSLRSQDMEKRIKTLLSVKVCDFEEEHLPHYLKLDNVRSALAEFRLYIHHVTPDSLFEDEKTLNKKIEQLDKLERIANSEEPVKARLDKLTEQVKETDFIIKMSAHRHLDTVSFAWLRRCILKLLTALHLYTPKHITHYDHLTSEILKKPVLNRHHGRHTFFQEADPRTYEVFSVDKNAEPGRPAAALAAGG